MDGHSLVIGDLPDRVFKWTPSFNPRKRSPLAPGGLDNGTPIKKRAIFSNKYDKLADQTDNLAEEHASWNGQIDLENGAITAFAVGGTPKCLNHSSPMLSFFEKNKNTSGLNIPLDNIPIRSQILSENMDIIVHNRSSPLNLNMVEIVGDNIINGSDFIRELAAGVLKEDNFGTFPNKIPPSCSKLAATLEGLISHLDTNGHLGGPTSTPLHVQKEENAQHSMESDTNYDGPYPLVPACVASSKVVGPGFSFSPLFNPTHHPHLAPPNHHPLRGGPGGPRCE
ncbi:hypothetical protein DH2020_047697 [Rehmannia glutinosa]|uniref:Uncharacterized protein n=1 Tax=Rehmannia glutinosa TaxID=99300 RepID=A0ABR0U8S5_REHGL